MRLVGEAKVVVPALDSHFYLPIYGVHLETRLIADAEMHSDDNHALKPSVTCNISYNLTLCLTYIYI